MPCTPQTCSSFHAKSIIFNYGSNASEFLLFFLFFSFLFVYRVYDFHNNNNNATVLSTRSSRLPIHIRSLASRCFYWIIRQLRSVRRILTFDTIIALVNALIISRTDYYSSILVGYISLLKLQGVLNSAATARLIARRRKYDSISSTIRDVLHWLPIQLCACVQLPP